MTSTSDTQNAAAFPQGRRTGRWPVYMVFAVFVLVIALVGVRIGISSFQSREKIVTADLFTCSPRAFTVSLKEKGELKAARSVDIACEVEGRATIISLIDEGREVQEGELLVELASDEIESRIRSQELQESNAANALAFAETDLGIQRDRNASEIRKAELQIELKTLALRRYEQGEAVQQTRDAQIALDQAKTNLQRRKEDFEAAKELLAKGYITQTQYDEDEFNFQRAQWDVQKAELAIEVLREYTHKADLRQRQSDLAEAQKEAERVVKNAEAEEERKQKDVAAKSEQLAMVRDELAKLRQQKEKCRILSPTQGYVVYAQQHRRWGGSEDQIREGATVYERQVLMQVPDTSEMKVALRIHEAKTDRLRMGQSATVRVEGINDKQFTGSVTMISTVADSENRWLNPDLKEYKTEITLDASEVVLKPGTTAHVEILVENVSANVAVPVQAIYSKGPHRFAFRRTGRTVEPVQVQLGSVSAEWAEVLSGLEPGDEVLLAYSDEHRRLVPDLPAFAGKPGPEPAATGPRTPQADRPATQAQPARKPRGERTPGGPGTRRHGGGGQHRRPPEGG